MATYGKTMREEMRTSGGAEEDFAFGADSSQAGGEKLPKRPVLSYVVLGVGLLLLFSGKWALALIALAVYVGILLYASFDGRFESAGADSLPRENENDGDNKSAGNSWR